MGDTGDAAKTHPKSEAFNHKWWSQFIRYVKRTRHHHRTQKESESSQDRAVRWTTWATVWIAIFTSVLAGVGYLQWKEMNESGAQTDRMISLYRLQVAQLSKQARDTHDLAVAAGKQADAGKALADLTAKQFAASQQLIESQRASINVSFGQVINPITFHDRSVSIAFSIRIQNTGSIKATHVFTRFTPYYSLNDANIFTEPLLKQRDYCTTDFSGFPTTTWDKNKKPVDLSGLQDWTVTIEPHGTYEWQINFGKGTDDKGIFRFPPPEVIATNPNLIATDRIFPIVVGCVDYQSGVMPEKHQTGFIFEIQQASIDSSPGNVFPTFIHYGVDVPREKVMITQFYFGQGRQY